jgi:6,7-dimethyl-8-ribityllumazine synthase
MTEATHHSRPSPLPRRIAFIQSCWHRDIVDQCRDSFMKEMAARGPSKIDLFEVPGAFEIPLQAKLLAKTGHYSAIVAAGFVVDGGIYRHEFVAGAVIDALMQVQLETEVPVKGAEAAHACWVTMENLGRLSALAEAA